MREGPAPGLGTKLEQQQAGPSLSAASVGILSPPSDVADDAPVPAAVPQSAPLAEQDSLAVSNCLAHGTGSEDEFLQLSVLMLGFATPEGRETDVQEPLP